MRGKYIIYTPDYITIQHSLSLIVVVLPLTFQWRVPSVFLNRSLELGLSELEFEYLKQIEDTSFPALSVSFLTGKYRTSSSRAQQVGAESRGQPLQWPTQSQTTQACTLPVLPSWVWVNKRKWRTALTKVGGKSIVASIWLVLPLTAPLDYFVRGTWHIMGRAICVTKNWHLWPAAKEDHRLEESLEVDAPCSRPGKTPLPRCSMTLALPHRSPWGWGARLRAGEVTANLKPWDMAWLYSNVHSCQFF